MNDIDKDVEVNVTEATEKELECVNGGGEELILPPPYVLPTLEPKREPFKPLVPLVVDPALGAH